MHEPKEKLLVGGEMERGPVSPASRPSSRASERRGRVTEQALGRRALPSTPDWARVPCGRVHGDTGLPRFYAEGQGPAQWRYKELRTYPDSCFPIPQKRAPQSTLNNARVGLGHQFTTTNTICFSTLTEIIVLIFAQEVLRLKFKSDRASPFSSP